MLNSVLRAPLSFFELTPTGRCVPYQYTWAGVLIPFCVSVLNLFSRDTYVVDQLLGRVRVIHFC